MPGSAPRRQKRPAEDTLPGETDSKKMTERTRKLSAAAQGPGPAAGNSSIETLMLNIEARQNARMDKLMESIQTNTGELKAVKDLVAARENAILDEVRAKDQKTNARIDELSAVIASGAMNSRESKRSEAYSEHRRSLRLWPVPGPDLKAGLARYLKDKLKFTDEEFKKVGNVSIKKHRDPSSKNPDEVVVLFESKKARDAIKAAGRNLATAAGTAGMRLHIPGHLQTNFNLLQNLGYHLKQSDEGIRRSIKFDDESEDLVMDVLVDGSWSRITPEEARKTVEDLPDLATGPKPLTANNITSILKKKTPATGANAT